MTFYVSYLENGGKKIWIYDRLCKSTNESSIGLLRVEICLFHTCSLRGNMNQTSVWLQSNPPSGSLAPAGISGVNWPEDDKLPQSPSDMDAENLSGRRHVRPPSLQRSEGCQASLRAPYCRTDKGGPSLSWLLTLQRKSGASLVSASEQ